ncbi:hypothetical protein ACH5RR_039664 [Cinchona calisaya]|uniref:Uncharacterized protein n=1 Tax=Cinchona calisaya TaxID=153742 RepID=A0ABD2XYX8_9GENT
MDASKASLSRPNIAYFCVEVDGSKPLLKPYWIGRGKVGQWQYINYEDLPYYCNNSVKLGRAIKDFCNLHSLQVHPSVDSAKEASHDNQVKDLLEIDSKCCFSCWSQIKLFKC